LARLEPGQLFMKETFFQVLLNFFRKQFNNRKKSKMGLLSEGSPLNWKETKKLFNRVYKHGVIQFINLYNRFRDKQEHVLKWDDKVQGS